jgi:SDR family mycofactocin-dependent oxidoreductase
VRLAEEGADIIAVDVCGPIDTVVDYEGARVEDLEETVALVEKLGRRIVPVQADVRDFDALREAAVRGVRELGRLDVVVANAGIATFGASAEQSEQQWQTMIDVNLTGVWHTTKATLPILVEQGQGGSVMITSSLMGFKGSANGIGYAAAKHGVVGIARSLAKEFAPHMIRVNSIHPTNVHTVMLDNPGIYKLFRPDLENPTFEDAKDIYIAMNLMPLPWVEMIDVSNAVLWLASDESRYVTGVALPVDLGAACK